MEDKNNIKLVFVGDKGTGKTSIINRLLGKDFDSSISTTVAASFSSKSLIIKGHSFTADIWDTAGSEMYRSMLKLFLKGAKGVFIVYNINNKESFDNIDIWIKILKEDIKDNVSIIIIGNKSDLYEIREVTVEQGQLKAKEYGANFIETSASSNTNIQKDFEILMKKITNKDSENYYKMNMMN